MWCEQLFLGEMLQIAVAIRAAVVVVFVVVATIVLVKILWFRAAAAVFVCVFWCLFVNATVSLATHKVGNVLLLYRTGNLIKSASLPFSNAGNIVETTTYNVQHATCNLPLSQLLVTVNVTLNCSLFTVTATMYDYPLSLVLTNYDCNHRTAAFDFCTLFGQCDFWPTFLAAS